MPPTLRHPLRSSKSSPSRRKATRKRPSPTPSSGGQSKPATYLVVLIDMSGSMMAAAQETRDGFNSYIKKLKATATDAAPIRVTVRTFSSYAYLPLAVSIPIDNCPKLDEENYKPGGNTPLYDAIGKTIAQTVDGVRDDEAVLFVTITDGMENDSKEMTLDTVKKAIKSCEAKNWTFAHIGVGPEGWAAARNFSSGTKSASNIMASTHDQTSSAYDTLARSSVAYAASSIKGQCVVTNFWNDPSGHGKMALKKGPKQ